MPSTPTIHLTGGLGFIGSNLIRWLNQRDITPIVYDQLMDERWRNVTGLRYTLRRATHCYSHLGVGPGDVLIHLAANVDTTERFSSQLWHNNVEWPLQLFESSKWGRIIYASSAAVYGAEESDFSERLYGPKPLNAYGFTKLSLDQAVFGGEPKVESPIYGLRFFNVYGPNEGCKGAMASAIHKALHGQLTGSSQHPVNKAVSVPHWSLFKSGRPDVADGEQARDFIHADDICSVIGHFALNETALERGLYNVGTGVARTFNDLARIIDPSRPIEYVEMPAALKAGYQYWTQADLTKLRVAGYVAPFLTLEEGIARTRATLKL